MYARISTYDIHEDHTVEAAAAFRAAFARLRGAEGLEAAYFLRACEGRRGVSITFWDTQAAMSASRVTASRLRSEAADSVSGDIVSVDEYEVAVADEGSPRVE
jgi:heme-degrading monooxygenase HmoA